MRERELIRRRARILCEAHGIKDFRHLRGRERIAYRYLLHALGNLSAYFVGLQTEIRTMNDQQLMEAIREKHGAAIHDACSFSTVPQAFLAALVANESGGDENAKRFEPHVFASLWEVVQGRAKAYGSLQQPAIVEFLLNDFPSGTLQTVLSSALYRMDALATSWGLTQIMGYEAIPFTLQLSDLALPAPGLRVTLRMLSQFAEHNDLDVARDFSELFDCWNTGRPHASTADPHYVPNGLARLKLYQSLLEQPPKAISA